MKQTGARRSSPSCQAPEPTYPLTDIEFEILIQGEQAPAEENLSAAAWGILATVTASVAGLLSNMPKEGETTGRADIGGGLEQSGKLPRKNYRPGYAKAFAPVTVPHVREEHFRFYKAPGNGHVQ